jgi:hypothetical protein
MTAIGDFCTTVRAWLALGPEVYPDELVTSWVRMTEEYLSENLRVKHMVQIDWSDLVESRVLLPADWQQLDYVRFRDCKPLIYAPRDEFFGPDYSLDHRYTIVGNYIIVGKIDETAGTEVEIAYYQNIPPLEDEPNWLMKYNSRIYTLCTCWHAGMYAIEDQRTQMWESQVATALVDLNRSHILSKSSGSILKANINKRSFG